MTAQTAAASTVHHPIGKKSLWHLPGNQELPAYIQNVAHAFIRNGDSESTAISKAVGVVKDWAAGRTPNGKGKVSPEVMAAAAKAIAEWEKLRAKTHTHANETDAVEMSNDHHDHEGRFAENPARRAAVIKAFQFQHGLEVTGVMDDRTKSIMDLNSRSVDQVHAEAKQAESAKLDEGIRNFFMRSVNG